MTPDVRRTPRRGTSFAYATKRKAAVVATSAIFGE